MWKGLLPPRCQDLGSLACVRKPGCSDSGQPSSTAPRAPLAQTQRVQVRAQLCAALGQQRIAELSKSDFAVFLRSWRTSHFPIAGRGPEESWSSLCGLPSAGFQPPGLS